MPNFVISVMFYLENAHTHISCKYEEGSHEFESLEKPFRHARLEFCEFKSHRESESERGICGTYLNERTDESTSPQHRTANANPVQTAALVLRVAIQKTLKISGQKLGPIF